MRSKRERGASSGGTQVAVVDDDRRLARHAEELVAPVRAGGQRRGRDRAVRLGAAVVDELDLLVDRGADDQVGRRGARRGRRRPLLRKGRSSSMFEVHGELRASALDEGLEERREERDVGGAEHGSGRSAPAPGRSARSPPAPAAPSAAPARRRGRRQARGPHAGARPAADQTPPRSSPDGLRPKRRRRDAPVATAATIARPRLALCGVTAPVRSKRAPASSQSASGMPGPRSRTASTALGPLAAHLERHRRRAVAKRVVDEVLAGLDERQRVAAAGDRILGQVERRRSSAPMRRSPRRCGWRPLRRSTVSCGAASARWMISAWLRSWSVSRLRPTGAVVDAGDDVALPLAVGLVGGELGLGAHRRDRRAQLVRGVGDQVAHDLELPGLAGHEAVDRADELRRSRAEPRRRAASGRAARARRARPRSAAAAPAPSGSRRRRAPPSAARRGRRPSSALRVISRASASRARVVWPTTTSTAPVKSRSENCRLTRTSRTGSPAKSPGGEAGRDGARRPRSR